MRKNFRENGRIFFKRKYIKKNIKIYIKKNIRKYNKKISKDVSERIAIYI